ESARLLRLGWLAGVEGVEAMAPDELREALESTDAPRDDDPGRVERLLPLRAGTAARRGARRPATEAVIGADLRFVQFRVFVLPESGPGSDLAPPGDRTDLLDSPAALTAFEAIQAVRPADPVQLRLDGVADRGRIGAIVSRVELSADSPATEA